MKAFKSINLKQEKRLVITYASMLSILSCFILLSPVWAQDQDNTDLIPRVRWDVQKDLNSAGKLLRYDSTWSRSVVSDQIDYELLDSLTQGMYFSHSIPFFDDSIRMDRSDFSLDLLSKLFQQPFDNFGQFGIDSLYLPYLSFPGQNKFKTDSLISGDIMMKHIMEFRAEHRKLMEKYFGTILNGEDTVPNLQQQGWADPMHKKKGLKRSI